VVTAESLFTYVREEGPTACTRASGRRLVNDINAVLTCHDTQKPWDARTQAPWRGCGWNSLLLASVLGSRTLESTWELRRLEHAYELGGQFLALFLT
jgi:hypothetical protein